MIKTEIKEFFVSMGEVSELRAVAPFSIGSLIDEGKLNKSACECPVTLNAYVSFDAPVSDGEYAFLRLRSIAGGSEISYNGELLERVSEYREQVTYDVTASLREGVNTLEIRTGSEDVLDVCVPASAEIIKTSYAIIEKVSVSQTHEDGKVTLGIRLEALGTSDSVRAVATLVSGSGQIYYGGITRGRGSITVPDPLYWWPKGLGVQNLYKLTVNIYGDMEIEDTFEARVGLCTLTTASGAEGALLEVNGVGFVPMGLTYDTPKARYIKGSSEELEASMAALARSGANTLVIPADCAMPSDRFFELCDLYGVVAIRESRNIKEDADALARVSHHASVGIIDVVSSSDDTVMISEQLHAINKSFEPSYEDEVASYPETKYVASYRTICEKLDKSERNLFSERVEGDCEGDVVSLIALSAEKYLYASNIYDFAYISELVAAQNMERCVMEARIARGKMGRAVFASLGKKTGVVSAGLVDMCHRPTAVTYRAAKFFAPVVAYAKAKGSTVEFYISNESRTDFAGVLEYKIIDSKNNVIYKNEEICSASASSAKLICARDLAEHVSSYERERVVEYSLISGSNVVYRSTLMLCEPKRFKLESPDIVAQISGADKKFSITLAASAFAKDVEIGFEGSDAIFRDNFIDITQNTPIKISFSIVGPVTTAEKLMGELRIKSTYDIGKAYI